MSAQPSPECKTVGTVIGQGGGAAVGQYISNDKLMEYALNDLMNKAAERGATHVHASTPQLGGSRGTTTTATVTGIAYRCPQAPGSSTPDAAAPADAASVADPASRSYLTDCPRREGETVRERALRCKREAAAGEAPDR